MKRGQPTKFLIHFEHQEYIDVTYLGKGFFCTAYQAGDIVYLKCKDACPEKEVVKLWGGDSSPYIPQIEEVYDAESPTKDYTVWKMPYYRTITANDKEAWAILKELQRAREEAVQREEEHLQLIGFKGDMWREYAWDIARRSVELASIPEDVREGLAHLVDIAGSYGSSMAAEFEPRNIGVDSEGHIVFRDILYDTERASQRLRSNRHG